MPRTGASGNAVRVEQCDAAAYLLGLGEYAYRDAYQRAEEYLRLHQVISALTRGPVDDREYEVLRCGAQLNQSDRLLAALLVRGARERLAAGDPRWVHISEDTYFELAVEHGKLMEYLGYWGHFAVPAHCDQADQQERFRRFAAHFLALPDGPSRQGLRLSILLLFDGSEEQVELGLALCNHLHGCDPLLDLMAARRIMFAVERDEIMHYAAAYRDLTVKMVATIGRWGVVGILPQLQRLLERTPPLDRDARVLRAHLQRSIEQLSLR